MIEGIENKEPRSPKIKDGEYIEEECKFLPPPKDILPPRLFLIRPEMNMAFEFLNFAQLEYFFRTNENSQFKTRKPVILNNEEAISHAFSQKHTPFDSESGLRLEGKVHWPEIPRAAAIL